MKDYKFHELADAFPMMSGKDIDDLADDIGKNGLLNQITLYEEKIIDGRHRYKACLIAGVKPSFKQLPDGVDPTDFVIAQNLHRRHLDESQRAMVGGRLADMRVGKPNSANLPNNISSKQAAEKLNVGVRSVTSAKKVLSEGHKAIQDAVDSGELAVATAEMFVSAVKDKGKQKDIFDKYGVDGVADIAKEERKSRREKANKDKKPDVKNEPVGSSMQFAQFAILQLERIQAWDTHKLEAVKLVEDWIFAKREEWSNGLSVRK